MQDILESIIYDFVHYWVTEFKYGYENLANDLCS